VSDGQRGILGHREQKQSAQGSDRREQKRAIPDIVWVGFKGGDSFLCVVVEDADKKVVGTAHNPSHKWVQLRKEQHKTQKRDVHQFLRGMKRTARTGTSVTSKVLRRACGSKR
jgi:hypothetical protein